MDSEEEGEVAVDPFFLQDLRGSDAFPGGGDLDEDALSLGAGRFVLGGEGSSLLDLTFGVEGEARIHFGGHASWNDLEDAQAELDAEAIDGAFDRRVFVVAGLGAFLRP